MTNSLKSLLTGALGVCTTLTSPHLDAVEARPIDPPPASQEEARAQAGRALAHLGPGFVYLADASAAAACAPRAAAEAALLHQIEGAQAALGLDVQLAILLSTAPVGCNDLYYVPIQNDVRGIGYAHTDGIEVFDKAPDHNLDGFVFLNDLPYWEKYPEEFRTAFLHEVGHRWGARVEARSKDGPVRLTGRQGGHWSYFLDSDGSPLEGNRFAKDPFAIASTPSLRLHYSRLDLYLMGVIAPNEVGPIRLLVGDNAELRDCNGDQLGPASPPQTCGAQRLEGNWLELGIGDVIAAEGPREPAFSSDPKPVSVGVFVLDNSSESWTEAECLHLTHAISERFADFAAATGQRLTLENSVGSGHSCTELIKLTQAQDQSVQGGCNQSARLTPRGQLAWNGLVLALLASIHRRRRRSLRLPHAAP